ncbi:hypothetical protein F2P45_02280 [Massilia sp. CCM 8733]|uniref:Prepilin type IV endopeptidase peptidase domain-containing protein n=1 Tax=Massilia mucilaginosa TaxID=2609282 RepID=A0ABX0NM63_9BURK|nr:hypothetical protein [Massilia mucilaginosa]NHZ87863.1 hypothetical protein [Massilia mucilaginosa]
MRESLLTPSLSPSAAPAANLYSVQSSFVLAFFGGPFAIILYSALNSWKLRRPLDALLYVAGLALAVSYLVAFMTGYAPLARLIDLIGGSAADALWRALALALMGIVYLMHRKQHRSAALFASTTPSPWIPAIACALLAYGMKKALEFYILAGLS